MTQHISRRSLLTGALSGGALLAIGGLATGCASGSSAGAQSASYTFADTIAWNAEYDVVVVGFGAAGATTSIYAADAGAQVLLLDAAPEGHEGGNSRYCAQICLTGNDKELLLDYLKRMAWEFEYDEEVLAVFAQGLTETDDIFKYIGVENPVIAGKEGVAGKVGFLPEYPEEGDPDGFIKSIMASDTLFDSKLWKQLRSSVMDRSDNISVWLEAPATRLIQEPNTGTIIGVEVNKQGETTLVHAKNGVVLTCGGFENNQEMIQDYLGAARLTPLGTLYNKGDGIKMAQTIGADLWHMNCWESLGILDGTTWRVEDGERAPLILNGSTKYLYGKGSIVLVGDDGSRYLREDEVNRHGHAYYHGVWRLPVPCYNPYIVFDDVQLAEMKEAGVIDADKEAKLLSATTTEELASKMGVDAAILAKTISDFNFFAQTGVDYAYARAAEAMRPFSGTTYYAALFGSTILNTQGGPKRNSSSQIVDINGNPIPHLYSAGECGGITIFHYNGGANISECLIFGRIAGTEAAKEKDPLPNIELAGEAQDDIKYSIGQGDYASEGDKTSEVELSEGQYLGTSSAGIGGEIDVVVTMDGDTITQVDVVKENETPDIGGKALETLPSLVVAANSTDIDVVSGATITSTAFIEAVTDALDQAK